MLQSILQRGGLSVIASASDTKWGRRSEEVAGDMIKMVHIGRTFEQPRTESKLMNAFVIE